MLKNYKPALPTQTLNLPEFPEAIYIRSWSQKQKNIIASTVDPKKLDQTYVKILANSICDEKGELQFTEKEAEVLLEYPSNLIEAIVKACYAFNGIDLDKIAEKKSN